MEIPETHRWDLTQTEAVALQKQLAGQVVRTLDFDPTAIRTVAGVDCSLRGEGQAAIVVLSWPDLAPVETAVATAPLAFPYVPGLLSFRETPLVLAALARLETAPDLLMIDGQGLIHPRRFGIACHVGVLTGIPSIGVAKSPFVGKNEEPGPEPGDWSPVVDRGEVIGAALRTRARVKPLYVSLGHRIDLPTALEFVTRATRGYRLPETTRAAHNLAGGADPEPVPDPRRLRPVPPKSPEQTSLF
ncbi:MAG TPA: deoxyribonuclease V [Armatimonadaceae bacterium]|nr:deoxyribonuclease V [Armatimonadaceae bacterium]